jgi:hypothetical protein
MSIGKTKIRAQHSTEKQSRADFETFVDCVFPHCFAVLLLDK